MPQDNPPIRLSENERLNELLRSRSTLIRKVVSVESDHKYSLSVTFRPCAEGRRKKPEVQSEEYLFSDTPALKDAVRALRRHPSRNIKFVHKNECTLSEPQ